MFQPNTYSFNMNLFTPGLRCAACMSHDLLLYNSNIIQCGACSTIDSLYQLTGDYFFCLDRLERCREYRRSDIHVHIGFHLNNYAYRKITEHFFEKVSARKYRFRGGGMPYGS